MSSLSWAQTTLVAVAANFSKPMQEIVDVFEKQTEHTVKLSFGSSGKFVAQIENGAPFDVFLAADEASVHHLKQSNVAVLGSDFIYAQGKLVLWSAQENMVDAQGNVLGQAHFKHLAIANPQLAPYGAAAVEFLSSKGLLTQLSPKIVEGENIAQVFQFVSTGNAELGFVAYSQILEKGQVMDGSHWVVPQSQYTPIKQTAILLKLGADNSAAMALLAYLKSPDAKAIIAKYGYDLTP
jgi:molybdate transport system substrate-binding protein